MYNFRWLRRFTSLTDDFVIRRHQVTKLVLPEVELRQFVLHKETL